MQEGLKRAQCLPTNKDRCGCRDPPPLPTGGQGKPETSLASRAGRPQGLVGTLNIWFLRSTEVARDLEVSEGSSTYSQQPPRCLPRLENRMTLQATQRQTWTLMHGSWHSTMDQQEANTCPLEEKGNWLLSTTGESPGKGHGLHPVAFSS